MVRKHAHTEEAEINITPMLDIVFIMLCGNNQASG
jgi:biopolymer transport protein ExbD